MVRSSVFYQAAHRAVLPKYLALVLASGAVLTPASGPFRQNRRDPIPAKLMVETVLFFANFAVQRLFIFKPSRKAEAPGGRAAPALLLGTICALVFFVLLAVEWLRLSNRPSFFRSPSGIPIGLKRFEHYTGAYLALAVPLLVIVPWIFAGFMAALLAVLSAVSIGPQAVLATSFFLLSSCALGSKLLRVKEDSAENHLLATLLGAAGYIFAMTFLARQPVNHPAVWAGILAAPFCSTRAACGGAWRSGSAVCATPNCVLSASARRSRCSCS